MYRKPWPCLPGGKAAKGEYLNEFMNDVFNISFLKDKYLLSPLIPEVFGSIEAYSENRVGLIEALYFWNLILKPRCRKDLSSQRSYDITNK